MSRRAGRDTWLYSNTRSGKRVEKSAAESKGRLEPLASDYVQRMLAPPTARIIHWGSETDKNSTVQSISKSAPDYPASHQLKDPFDGLYTQGIALEPPLPPERLLNLTEESTLHSGCLMAKAYDACGRGWDFEPREGRKGDKMLMESDLPQKMREGLELMTPDLTFGELLYQAAWESQAIGWAIWEVVRMPDQWSPRAYAPIGAIYPIPSFTMRATIDPRRWVQIRAGRVRFFKKFGAKCEIDAESGKIYEWADASAMRAITEPARLASEIIVFKEYSPRSLWYGIPKWISAIPTIAELTAIREFNVSWFASGGQTDYIVHFKADTLENAMKMAADLKQQMQENQGRGHTHVVTAGTTDTEMNVEKLGELLREGHFRFRRGDLAKEVLIAHNVPPYRIGWAEVGGGSGLAGNPATEMLGAYKYGAIQPIQVIIEDRLRATLFDKDMGIDTGMFRLKLKELELDDMEKALEHAIKCVEHAIMTPNQARESLGMDPVEKVPGKAKGPKVPDEKESQVGVPTETAEGEAIEPIAPGMTKAVGDGGPQAEPEQPPVPGEPGKDDAGGNLNGPDALAGEDEGQVEAMNTYYYQGSPLGEKPEPPAGFGGPPKIGPDGKPLPPKPSPFGKPEGPDGAPMPGPEEKSVDKALGVIADFEKALRESLKGDAQKSTSEDGSDISGKAPPERRPSRRPRR